MSRDTSKTVVDSPAGGARPVRRLKRELIGERFVILGLVGSGGMGTVYRARDTELGDVVALKMLHAAASASPERLELFRREVRLARRVTHPNVARTHDIGVHGAEKFLTMEFIDGEPLSAVLRRDKLLPLERITHIFGSICAGLEAAHAVGVVHRDLKPDNVLLSRGGRVVITDFGIADLTAEAAPGGGQPGAFGTPAYMAPEQIQRRSNDARTDIYGLGVMLYEMLTGELPWRGDDDAVALAARLEHAAPDPRHRRPDVPPALAALVVQCTAPDPAQRPQRVARVVELLALPGAAAAAGLAAERERDGTLPPPLATGSAERFLSPADLVAAAQDARARDQRTTVAVLPFRNAGAPVDDHWAEGFTDDLIETLSLLERLKVLSRGAAARFRGDSLDPREVGHRLDVEVVVEGSVRRHGTTLRVVVRVVSVADGFQIWACRFDRPDSDLLAIADEAATEIAGALLSRPPLPVRTALRDPVALDLYFRARQEYRTWIADNLQRAADQLEEALRRAPDDPRLLSADAMVWARAWLIGMSDGQEGYDRATAAVDRARLLAPELGEPHIAAATFLLQRLDLDGVARELRAAVRKSPNLPEAHDFIARLLCECGRLDLGLAMFEHAASQFENPPETMAEELARSYALMGDWSRAWAQCGQLTESRSGPMITVRARLLVWAGHRDEAEAIVRESARWSSVMGIVAGAMFDDVLPAPGHGPRRDRRDLFFLQLLVESKAARGQASAAVELIEEGARRGLFDLAWLDRCPLFADLRADPDLGQRLRAARAGAAERAERLVAGLLAP